LRRWRSRLLLDRLTPPQDDRLVTPEGAVRRAQPDSSDRADTFDDPTLEALARLIESRWLIGLARLYEADRDLNLEIRRRLTAVVDFGGGVHAPVWPVDTFSLNTLLHDLLDQTLSERERARRARQWLQAQPQGIAWVLSDAGRRSLGTEPMTTVGLVNLRWDVSAASLQAWNGAAEIEIEPLPPVSAASFGVRSRPDEADRAAVVARIDRDQTQLAAWAADLAAKPPGLRITGLSGDWNLADFLARAQPRRPSPEPASALLYRDHLGRWVLYVECAASGTAAAETPRLRLTLGSESSATGAYADIWPSGETIVHRDPAAPPTDPAWLAAEVGRYEGGRNEGGQNEGGWFARVTLPDDLIEDGRLLRLGLEHIDSRGRRSAWPRPMLPWQTQPPRAAIDLATWDG
jgi:hypothetical protein